MDKPKRDSLQLIISSAITIFIVLLAVYIGLFILSVYDTDEARQQLLLMLTQQISSIGSGIWSFIKPFLQILILLTIVEWILRRLGISFSSKGSKFEWDVQTIIALVVVSAFSVAALSGISEGADLLKDLVLVVVGFYFGSQKRTVEYQTERGRLTVSEEHKNEFGEKLEQEGEEDTKDSRQQ